MRFAKVLLLLSSYLAVVLIMGCSSDDEDNPAGPNNGNDTTSTSIGPVGGTIELTGGASLEIPAGALTDTVDFTVSVNSSPTPPSGTNGFVSSCYTFGPSGTQFDSSATMTVPYSESQLNGAAESSIKMFTNSGSSWSELTTTVDEVGNSASAEIDHLSDFTLVVDTSSGSTEGVFAVLSVCRAIMPFVVDDTAITIEVDFLSARFDTSFTPCEALYPVAPNAVSCNQNDLVWNEETSDFVYPGEFIIELGQNYTFEITGNSVVPSLTSTVQFPTEDPYIVSPVTYDTLSLSGFTVTWNNPGSGTVQLNIVTSEDTTCINTGDTTNVLGMYVETENDGSYTFTSGQLSELVTGEAVIALNCYNMEAIVATGYDSRSGVMAVVTCPILVYLE